MTTQRQRVPGSAELEYLPEVVYLLYPISIVLTLVIKDAVLWRGRISSRCRAVLVWNSWFSASFRASGGFSLIFPWKAQEETIKPGGGTAVKRTIFFLSVKECSSPEGNYWSTILNDRDHRPCPATRKYAAEIDYWIVLLLQRHPTNTCRSNWNACAIHWKTIISAIRFRPGSVGRDNGVVDVCQLWGLIRNRSSRSDKRNWLAR